MIRVRRITLNFETPQEVCCYIEAMSLFFFGGGRPSVYQARYKMISLCVELRGNLPRMVVFNLWRLLLENVGAISCARGINNN